MPQAQGIGRLRQALIDDAAFESAYAEFLVTYGAAGIVEHMTTTAEPRAALTPVRISRLDVPEVESLRNDAVRGFFTRQQREEGLTSNWFRALSLNEDDLGRLNAYLVSCVIN